MRQRPVSGEERNQYGTATVDFRDVSKYYGSTVGVKDLTLQVPPGELFGLLGPNGAGKTTTIKLLTGLLRPTRGDVLVGGIDIEHEPERAKQLIGYVPDDPYLYEVLTGTEFLQFIGRLYGMAWEEISTEITRLSEYLDMSDWLDLRAEEYSHGMKQKVVISSALLHDPDVLVIDEPMVGLDPKSARLVINLLQERTQRGKTVFISTHTLALAESICTCIGVINKGTLIAMGSLDELRSLSGRQRDSLEELYMMLTEGED